MEGQGLPACLERVVERKEDEPEEMVARVADVPDEGQARRVRFQGATAKPDQTLDRQRQIRAASATPGPTSDPSAGG